MYMLTHGPLMLQRPLNRLVHPCDPVLQVLHQVRLRARRILPIRRVAALPEGAGGPRAGHPEAPRVAPDLDVARRRRGDSDGSDSDAAPQKKKAKKKPAARKRKPAARKKK